MKSIIVNNITISVSTNANKKYAPIRATCRALGIEYSKQLKKIKKHPEIAPELKLQKADVPGKGSINICMLPIKHYVVWLNSVNPVKTYNKTERVANAKAAILRLVVQLL